MINLDEIRTTVREGLAGYLGIPVIRGNSNGDLPSYPFCSYNITILASENNGTWGKYEGENDRKPFNQTWSITVQSDNISESMENALKAREWFDHVGTVYLNDNDVIVQRVGAITNRDNLLTVGYEYKNGFDVVFYFMDEVENTDIATGYIEHVELQNENEEV